MHDALDAQDLARNPIKEKVNLETPSNRKGSDACQFPCAKLPRPTQSGLSGQFHHGGVKKRSVTATWAFSTYQRY
jgi:hypothetical protein